MKRIARILRIERIDPRGFATRAAFLISAFAAAGCTETQSEKHVDIPGPIAVAQWAERVDTLEGTYTFASAPVQFGDTLVVLADGQDETIWKIELATGKRSQIGTKGDGPGEYRYLGAPAKISGDSVALLFGTPVYPIPVISVVNGRGRTHTIRHSSAGDRAARLQLQIAGPILSYADSIGNVYGNPLDVIDVNKETGRPDMRSRRSPDPVPVVRYNIRSGRTDTVLQMPAGSVNGPAVVGPDGSRASPLPLNTYGAFNSWIVTQDGRLITADAAHYTIQVRDTAGVVVSTWQIPSNPVPVSSAGWNDYVQKTTKGSIVALKELNERTFAKIGVAAPKLPQTRYVVPEMPRELPRLNFAEGARRMYESENVLWLPVHIVDPPSAQNWDLINLTTGKRTTTVTLPDKQFLVQVTNLGAYVVAVDEDDVQRVLLYRNKKQ